MIALTLGAPWHVLTLQFCISTDDPIASVVDALLPLPLSTLGRLPKNK
jgi:hypothetical protein